MGLYLREDREEEAVFTTKDAKRTQASVGVGGLLMAFYEPTPEEGYLYLLPGYDGNGNVIAWFDRLGVQKAELEYGPFG